MDACYKKTVHICNGCGLDITGWEDQHAIDAIFTEGSNPACGAWHTDTVLLTQAHWEQVLVREAWDEQVQTKAAWDEQVQTKAAWDEQVQTKAAYDSCSCGATK